jgi:hypothetical protein
MERASAWLVPKNGERFGEVASRFWLPAMVLCLLGAAPASDPSELDVAFAQIDAVDPGLASYTATVDFNIGLKSFPWYRFSRHGTAFYKRPGQLELVIEGMPRFASSFHQIFVGLGPTKNWTHDFDASVVHDPGPGPHILLTPKNSGSRVRRIDVFVDGPSGIPARIVWTYSNGHIELDESLKEIDGHRIVVAHDVDLQLPAFHAFLHANVHDIAMNAPVDDAVFTKSLFLNP